MTDAAGAAEPTETGSEERSSRWLEIIAACLLGTAGLLTAYAAYQAALTDGDALKGYTESSQTRADANGYYSDGFATYASDQALFLEYQLLVEQDQIDTAIAVRASMFSPELEAATVAWEETDDETVATPLETEEYVIAAYTTADELTAQAEAEFDAAQTADNAGDKFELAAVFLAVSLFLAGIATLFKSRAVRIAVLIGAAVFIVPGVISIIDGRNAL